MMYKISAGELIPASLGFVLLRTNVMLSWTNRPYRGLDRLPEVPSPFSDLPQGTAEVWDFYQNAFDDGSLAIDHGLALEASRRLGAIGTATEVAYAYVAAVPRKVPSDLPSDARMTTLRWLRERPNPPARPPTHARFIGVDIVTPLPSYHSALKEPGLISKQRGLVEALNESGLLAQDGHYAHELMDEANSSGYLLSTFCVVEVYACGSK